MFHYSLYVVKPLNDGMEYLESILLTPLLNVMETDLFLYSNPPYE